MNDNSKNHEALSPAKRALYELLLKKKREQEIAASAQPIARAQEASSYPLSFAQQRIWFIHQLMPDNPAFNVHVTEQIKGALNVPALESGLKEVVRRHKTMRTRFITFEGKPVQVVSEDANFILAMIDLSQLNEYERSAQLQKFADKEARRSFDLTNGPLLRATLFKKASDEHVLLLVVHHIISDGWSMDVFIQELVTLYEAYSNGRQSPLPELPIQYTDFALWQMQWLQGERLEKLLSYWTKQLAGPLPSLQLPEDWPRPGIQTARGANAALSLTKRMTEGLNRLSREQGATLFMTLLAAFKALLHRYTGQDDIIVGTPVANRSRTETHELIGVFINMLALRTKIADDASFLGLLGRVREVCLEAFSHEDLPFERLVEELQPERDTSRHPIFQAMIVHQNATDESVNLAGLKLTPLPVGTETSQVDIALSFLESVEGLQLAIDYNIDLFSAGTIKRFLNHFHRLLESLVENPRQRIYEIPLLTDGELRQVVYDWNETARDYARDVCLHHLFEAQVKLTPNSIAVTCGHEQLTYSELNRRANQLAHFLIRFGVGPDVCVGICIERSTEMVIGLLGILKAGGAYVPIDPTYPKDRLAFMLADADVPVLLTHSELADQLMEHNSRIVCLDTDWEDIGHESGMNPDIEIQEQNLAYMIYTSGSTGKPKGATIPHRGICNRLIWMQEAYQLTGADRVLQKTPFSFDVSVWEFFWPLIAGARLVMARPGGHQDRAYLIDEIFEQGITTIHFVPSMLQVFLAGAGLNRCDSLKRVICSGEAFPHDLQERFLESLNANLYNLYGPTEASVDVTAWQCRRDLSLKVVPIGYPIANTQIHILDKRLNPAPVGIAGELYIGGIGLARGYHDRPELTAEKFVPNPVGAEPGSRLYRTGDLARYFPDGNIEFLGRMDYQVKIRGFRIEVGEIEAALSQHESVQESIVIAKQYSPTDRRLVAYVVGKPDHRASVDQLRSFLKEMIPNYMVPSVFILLDKMPLTSHGKTDRSKLPDPELNRSESEASHIPPRNEVERVIASIWKEVLKIEKVGIHENFFDLGGHSLLLAQVHSKLQEELDVDITMLDLFKYPTISALAEHVSPQPGAQMRNAKAEEVRHIPRNSVAQEDSSIAIIGMAGRFPGAKNLDEFWQNLKGGIRSITSFSDKDLLDAGVDPELLENPNYVKAGATLDDIELFDASFFGINPREAKMMDPQQRFFMECAHEALENAGYDPESYEEPIGLYAGASLATYWLNLFSNPDFIDVATDTQTQIGNDKDHLATRVSYKLNLKGPSLTVQTTCSTSLVAVHLACISLLNGECRMALAGGISIAVPQKQGYLYQEEGIRSPDGYCRAFDAKAQGTVAGNGVGIVVLKRLSDALADDNNILAVIKGTAVNNDGSLKVGYTAPSVSGQAQVIARAQSIAGIHPDTVSYIEAHGTGTTLGDPIEVAALTQAFRAKTDKKQFCAIGSVKTNIGHLDAAAGVAGLIKTALAINHKLLPPSLHYEEPNPNIDFANSPFFVNSSLREWDKVQIRRAGVSSFGIGGTNAHAIIEEPPSKPEPIEARPKHLLILSAKTEAALDRATANLAEHLDQHRELSLDDVAYTLQVGRKAHDYRRIIVCGDVEDAIACLRTLRPKRVFTSNEAPKDVQTVFMFPGQGAQYVNMGFELYQHEPVFRRTLDQCSELLLPHLGVDLRTIIYQDEDKAAVGGEQLGQTCFTQPAVFAFEYALAKLWTSWGVQPHAMIGHSIGEYTAACLAGVFSLEEALQLVAVRGRLMQGLPQGAMLAVPLPSSEAEHFLNDRLSIAASNGPSLCVVSGDTEAVEELRERLSKHSLKTTRLHTSHAFHSQMTDPIINPFLGEARKVRFNPPRIPFMSNLTGTWITAEDATDPNYWAKHLRQTVRFDDAVEELLEDGRNILLEVGPGQTLSTLVKRHSSFSTGRVVLSSLGHPEASESDFSIMLRALGRLWAEGVKPDWQAFNAKERRRRIPLPTYPFERRHYWIEPLTQPAGGVSSVSAEKQKNIADWFYIPYWKPSATPTLRWHDALADRASCWLVFNDSCGLGAEIIQSLDRINQIVFVVEAGTRFARIRERVYTIDPGRYEDYNLLLKEVSAQGGMPDKIVHLWNVTAEGDELSMVDDYESLLKASFYGLMFLAQAMGEQDSTDPAEITIVSNNVQQVGGTERVVPEKATLLGPCKIIPLEFPNITCRSVDISISERAAERVEKVAEQVLSELSTDPFDKTVAYRGNQRWLPNFEPVKLDPVKLDPVKEDLLRLKKRGVYLITGGTGGIGLELATCLAQTVQARLVLLGRSPFPGRDEWEERIQISGDDSEIGKKLKKLLALEQAGAEVMVVRADVADERQMRQAIATAQEQFGKINGIIHAAGVPGGGLISIKTREMAASILAPKVQGTRVIESIFKDYGLDFLVLCSSLTSILGGLGQIDYCAANAFLDSFAKYNTDANDTFTISINWDAWQEVGMAANAVVPLGFGAIDVEGELASREFDKIDAESTINRPSQRLFLDGILPNQGRDVFFRVLSRNTSPQIAVSTKELNGLIQEASKFTQKQILEEMLIHQPLAYPRPNVQTPFVAPRNQTESTIAEALQQLLGISEIGIHDDFFELGGHSLLALQLISRVREFFSVEMKMRSLFEAPTVAGLSEMVEQLLEEGNISEEPAIISISRDAYRIKVGSQQEINLPNAMRKKNEL